jgi:hypothetical protein
LIRAPIPTSGSNRMREPKAMRSSTMKSLVDPLWMAIPTPGRM